MNSYPMNQPLWLATDKNIKTRQFSTFDPARRTKTILLHHNSKQTIGEVNDTGIITSLWMTFPVWFWQHWNPSAPVSQTILKNLILRIYWDGATLPAVEAPVGDFFGIGLSEVQSFSNLFFGMSSGGFFCKFPMPFRKGFRIEMENLDPLIDTDLFMNILYQSVPELPENQTFFQTRFSTGRKQGVDELEVAQVEGCGHYAGISLSMQGEDQGYLSFLEAPEYFFIDEDWNHPRLVGTGLEDYFLGGWYFREGTFAAAYHGLPVKDPLNASVAMYRVHDADRIHFNQRFRMSFINPFDPQRLRPYAYSSVVYLYLNTPQGSSIPFPTRDELHCWYRVRNCDHQSIP